MKKDDETAEEIADETQASKGEKWGECGCDGEDEGRGARGNEAYEGEEKNEAISEPKQAVRAADKGLKAKNEDLVSDLKRLQAQFENYQKRVEKEKAEMRDSGKREVLTKMIALADEFDSACEHMHRSSESELRNGIRLLQKKLVSMLEEEGVRQIECFGKKFSPDECDAVEIVPTEDGDDGVVLKEMRKGYKYRGTVIRHSMVGVSKKKAGEKE